MPPLTKRRRHLASIAQAGGQAPKRPKSTVEEDQAFFSEGEEDSDDPKSILMPAEVDQAFISEREEDNDLQEVDESGDSSVSSNSDDEVLYSFIPKIWC